MWSRITIRGRQAIFAAEREAERFDVNEIGPEHLLLALLQDSSSVAARMLQRQGVSREALRADLERSVPRGQAAPRQEKRLTPAGNQVIDLAYGEACALNNNYIGTEHLLLGIAAEERSLAARLLREHGAPVDPLHQVTWDIHKLARGR